MNIRGIILALGVGQNLAVMATGTGNREGRTTIENKVIEAEVQTDHVEHLRADREDAMITTTIVNQTAMIIITTEIDVVEVVSAGVVVDQIEGLTVDIEAEIITTIIEVTIHILEVAEIMVVVMDIEATIDMTTGVVIEETNETGTGAIIGMIIVTGTGAIIDTIIVTDWMCSRIEKEAIEQRHVIVAIVTGLEQHL